jgi:response regulator of citrate/malate metabolism
MDEKVHIQVKNDTLRRKAGFGLSYSQADLKFIKENITTMKLTEMAVLLNRNFDTLRHKVSRMGLSDQRIYSFKPYTTDDVAFLQENGTKYTIKELIELTGRTFDSLEKKLRTLNIKAPNQKGFERLTEKEIKFISKNYAKFTNKQLADKLNKSNSAISKKLEKLGLRYPKQYSKKTSDSNSKYDRKLVSLDNL